MKRQIVIDFDLGPDPPLFIHRMRNFGEDLWRLCEDDAWASISLDEVDRAPITCGSASGRNAGSAGPSR